MIKIQAIKDYYQYNGKDYKSTDGLGKICRELMSQQGFVDSPMGVYRGDMLCLTVRSIRGRGNKVLNDTNRDGLRWSKYDPDKFTKYKRS